MMVQAVDDLKLPESIETAIIDLLNKVRFGSRTNPADREPLRRAIAADRLRLEADVIERYSRGSILAASKVDHLRREAAALEAAGGEK